MELLEHLLNKLPKDVCEVLLKQQSKGRLNTVCPYASTASINNLISPI